MAHTVELHILRHNVRAHGSMTDPYAVLKMEDRNQQQLSMLPMR
jgi:hypothetical protein